MANNHNHDNPVHAVVAIGILLKYIYKFLRNLLAMQIPAVDTGMTAIAAANLARLGMVLA